MGVNCDGISHVTIEELQAENERLQAVVERLVRGILRLDVTLGIINSKTPIKVPELKELIEYAKQHSTRGE